MREKCAVFEVIPWVDRSRPKPEPRRIEDVEIPAEKGQSSHSLMVVAKAALVEKFQNSDFEIRSTPSIVADPSSMGGAKFVAYVAARGPQGTELRRKPVSRGGRPISKVSQR